MGATGWIIVGGVVYVIVIALTLALCEIAKRADDAAEWHSLERAFERAGVEDQDR